MLLEEALRERKKMLLKFLIEIKLQMNISILMTGGVLMNPVLRTWIFFSWTQLSM